VSTVANTIVGKQIARGNANMVLTGIALIGLAVLIGVWNQKVIVNFLRGPQPANLAQIATAGGLEKVDALWLSFTDEDPDGSALNTGWVMTTQSTVNGIPVGSASNEHSYFVVLVDETQALLVQVSASYANTERIAFNFTGYLNEFSFDVSKKILPAIKQDLDEQGLSLVPFMVVTSDYRADSVFGVIVLTLLAVSGAVCLLIGISRLGTPEKHPYYKPLSYFGEPTAVAQSMEQSMSAPHQTYKKRLHLTDQWLVVRTRAFKYTTYEHLAWVYPKVTKVRLYGIIPISSTHELVVQDRHGQHIAVPLGKKDVDAALQVLTLRAPWAVYGHSDDIKKMWDKNRPDFLQAVEQRRAKMTAANAPQ
jgi:hypothetical protein